MTDIHEKIQRFLDASGQPVLIEDGDASLALSPGNFLLESHGGHVSLQAWNDRRNLVRRISGIATESRGRMVLRVERFGKRPGILELVDLLNPSGSTSMLRAGRHELREQFRTFLGRQYPWFKIADLSTEADLEHSLSPAYPRALIRQGASAWAAIAADRCHTDGVLTFGLIWLDYLRSRAADLAVRGLILYLPEGCEKTTCLRLRFLNADAAQFAVFVYDSAGFETAVDLCDYGNLDTRLGPSRRHWPSTQNPMTGSILDLPEVKATECPGGETSLRVNGLEFARTSCGELKFGIQRRLRASPSNLAKLYRLADELSRLRSADAADHMHPLYVRNPEAWLEAQVRSDIQAIDARLLETPVYGQVPAFAAGERGVIDLLAVEPSGRLAILELKASEDVHFPLQALDYWIRVQWHLNRRDFPAHGYFPGIELRNQSPRLLLVAPAMEFHPACESILRYFSPDIPVERVGVGLQWRKELKVVWRS